ncbi:M35 family metallopeptidase [Pseudomonas glycinae]|uniref:M35 family metallopeptidase n=1 Tax=Pseudomonas glycinae TaxID=1785145 RepID=UPI001F4654C7|nr:M35 family metallopeptidase [Pseudomonas glycinae]
MLKKISTTIVPICKALVDPADELLETERFVVGSNKYLPDVIAFVLDGDQKRLVHFTEHFFDQQLDAFKPFMQVPFDVDGHAQASTLIHEFSHQFSKTLDIATLRAREPFCDLISTLTPDGLRLYEDLEFDQSSALSLSTPREQLFAEWNTTLKTWMGIDKIADMQLIYDEVLQLTGAKNLLEARNAFLDRQNPDVRFKVILRNADSVTRLICEIGRQLDPIQSP